MRIVTMNIRHGGGKRAQLLIEQICRINPDILVLTEFRNNPTGKIIQDALTEQGLTYQETVKTEPKTNTVLIASHQAFDARTFDKQLGINSHRCVLATFREFNLYGFYFPNQEAKRPVFEFLHTLPDAMEGKSSLLMGDFNTGLHYLDEKGATLICADRFAELAEKGWVDLWRTRSLEVREFSWYSPMGNGFRLDQALGSPAFNDRVKNVFYDHSPRESKSTDHSAMVVDVTDF